MNKNYTNQMLRKHLTTEHKISPFSQYLREIVYGGNDGIVTTFAVVAGFAGANASSLVSNYTYLPVLLFGLANLFADGASMGLGNFLSTRSNQDVYREEKRKELTEIRKNRESEIAETKHILESRGYSEKDAEEMTKLYTKNENHWLSFMMNEELGLPDAEGDNAVYTGLVTFVSFIFFGFIPLTPYVFLKNQTIPFYYAVGATLVALMFLGFLRWRVTRESISRSIGEVLLLGGVSSTIAFVVGSFFRV